MKTLRLVLILLTTLLLISCGGSTAFLSADKNKAYTKTIDGDLLVVFEISHLKKAMSGDSITPNIAANAVLLKLALALKEKQTVIAGEVIDSTADRSQFIRVLAKHRSKKQVLTIQASSFYQIQNTYYAQPQGAPYWGGEVTWTLQLFDLDKAANPEGKAVWTAKTDGVRFGPGRCNSDKYETCADRFASAIVNQLKADGLIK